MNFLLYLIFTASGLAGIFFIFFKMQEQPMEIKLGLIVIISLVEAVVMRKLRKKAKGFLKNAVQETLEWSDTLIWSGIVAFFIMYFFIQAYKIPSGSMRNTFLEGDHLFVNKFVYGIRLFYPAWDDGLHIKMKRIFAVRKPKKGDIVVFRAPDAALEPYEREAGIKKDYVKRCIGLPGDKIEVVRKKLYVNDVLQQEPYVNITDVYYNNAPQRDNFGPYIVPDSSYFMMGDNRDNSKDSRFWGALNEKYIKGKPLFIYWPPKRVRIAK